MLSLFSSLFIAQSFNDYFAIGSYEIVKRMSLHRYYIYFLFILEYAQIAYLLSYELQKMINLGDVGEDGTLVDKS